MVDPDSGTAYMALGEDLFIDNHPDEGYLMVDYAENAMISLTAIPSCIALDPNGTHMYVADDEDYLNVIDLYAGQFIEDIDVGDIRGLVATEDGRLYALDGTSKSIRVFDISDPTAVSEISSVGLGDPLALNSLALNEARNELYVCDLYGDSVKIIKTTPTISSASLTVVASDKLNLKAALPLGSAMVEDSSEIGYYISTDSKLSPTNLVGKKVVVKEGNADFPYALDEALSGLDKDTTYYVMVYATSEINNSVAYSQVMSANLAAPGNGGNVPKTGDNSPMALLFLIAAAGSAMVLLKRTKNESN